MTKPQVLFIGDLNQDLAEYKLFEQKFECIHYTITTREQLIHDFKTKFSKVEAIYAAWLAFHLVGGFNGDLLEASPESLKIITVCSVGYDGFDLNAMRERGIVLTNAPHLGSEHVADMVLHFTLLSFRFFQVFTKELSKYSDTIKARVSMQNKVLDSSDGHFKEQALGKDSYAFGHTIGSQFPIMSPSGQTVTIVGFGNIGKRIASRLSAIGMRIQCVKRSPLTAEEESKLPFKVHYFPTLEAAAPTSNLVVLSLPGTKETANLFNAKVIARMPPRSRVINVGRGLIVNDDDLLEGLKSGKLIFAGLDVFNGEPKIHPELLDREDVVCTPHIGSATIETYNDSAIYALQNIENRIVNGLDYVASLCN